MTQPLEMRISLNALEHLGINLYSTVPAVLSEIVANAWDADATQVCVDLDRASKTIVIKDDGMGMTRADVIDRFLMVGFRRRTAIGSMTAKLGRHPMGRKGIGKLSSFSIAQVVTVYTAKDDERTAFRMDVDAIRNRIKADDDGPYCPDELTDWPDNMVDGTRIVLSGLQKKITTLTSKGLRQRLSRRFSIIGPKHDFKVLVNGTSVMPSDRGYYEHVEYLWTFGDQLEAKPFFKNLVDGREVEDRSAAISDHAGASGIQVTGWMGTVKHPRYLKDEDGENLNRLAIFMRGKLAQEDILADFGQKEIYADYLVGEIHCDDLDDDSKDDIATSSRQSLKDDDPRFEALRGIVYQELRHVAGRWSDWRRGDGTKMFVGEVPEVLKWLEDLKGDTKKKAERWIGRLNVIRSDKDTEKRELLKASILAFESYRRKEQLDFLDNLTDQSIEPILQVFNDIDDLQLSYYGQIVKLRLGVVMALERKLSADDKETVIRDHIFDHLWLLDPSWERVTGSEHAERTLTTFLNKTSETLTPEQRMGRVDIGYRTASGRHVIIELKRASVATPVDDLARQIRKYRAGAKDLLAKSSYPNWPLDIVCLVGKPPPEWDTGSGREDVERTLASVDARLVFYNELLGNSQRAYADYLEEHKKIDRLWKIFQSIDDFASDAEAAE